jgi:N-acetylglucosamine-6-phosphate deacetylase
MMHAGQADATVLAGDRVVTPDAVLEPGWVRFGQDRIVDTGPGTPSGAGVLRLAGTLVPGFVDVHVHGGGGAQLADDADAACRAVAAHRRHGTTTLVASLATADMDRLERSVRLLADLVTDGRLAGIHLEGPWLSPRQPGAHPASLLRSPDARDVRRLLSAGTGAVRMVTLAPELPGGLDAVREVLDAGAVAAIGHTDATYDVALAAVDAGARLGTHLFNAMRSIHHREPGAALALLEDARVAVELIADGVHLHPAVLRHAARSVGPGRWLLVTDAMAAAAAGEGRYRLGDLDVQVSHAAARLADGTIAGSTLTLDAAVRHAVQVCGLPLQEAVQAASQTPADRLGLREVGCLAPGMRADVVVLDGDLRVAGVLLGGRWEITPDS